jgi:hypothetical protein
MSQFKIIQVKSQTAYVPLPPPDSPFRKYALQLERLESEVKAQSMSLEAALAMAMSIGRDSVAEGAGVITPPEEPL